MGIWFWFLAVFLLFVILLNALPRIIQHRSFRAALFDYGMRILDTGVGYKGEREDTVRKIEERATHDPFVIKDPEKYGVPIDESYIDGIQTFTINKSQDPKYFIFYMAGGGFLNPPKRLHMKFLTTVCKETGAEVLLPLYPRIPYHTYRDSYPKMVDIYVKAVEAHPNSKIILSGDSSGGNMAMVIAEHLLLRGYRQPDEIILMSPAAGLPYEGNEEWFDRYEKRCPMLGVAGCNTLAEYWAGDTDIKHWEVSPLFGKTEGIGRTTIFVGDRELFLPSCTALHQKLKETGVDSTLIVGKGMNHVYPIIPIPEARRARRTYEEIIKR